MNTGLQRLHAKRAALERRAACLRAIREFFHSRDFMEVETPVRLRAPAQERHIDAEPAGALFLRTSPELHMKRLLAAGYERLYQMGPCFRRNERGPLHHPEYTMLEWYRAAADYHDIRRDTIDLIRHVTRAVLGAEQFVWQGRTIRTNDEWSVISVRNAFMQWAGWDPVAAYEPDRFDLDLVEKIEPALREQESPVILTDYPQAAAALARLKPDDPDVAERWELYIAGLEIANAYSELTEPREQRERFNQCAEQRRAAGLTAYPVDTAFFAALEHGLPPCGGIALGVDRLVMLLADAPTLADVVAFTE